MRQRLYVRLAGMFGACALLLGCASVYNVPLNVAADGSVRESVAASFEDPAYQDDLLVGLTFSGGGTRAAAFSFGVLEAMNCMPVRGAGAPLIDRIDFISGVSGGSVTAAYFGLRKRAGLQDFRERFLFRNAEEGLQTTFSLGAVGRALGGGVNDQTGFTTWLDRNLFDGATFGDLRRVGRPRIWINASDIYNRTPFVFGATAFSAICSDLASYPISSAVAASAAVPIAFAPIVIEAFPGRCNDPLPEWIVRWRNRPNASPMLTSFAKAISRYREGGVPYIKLLDGGLVDNYGVSGFTISRESSETPYGPLTPKQAVHLRRAMFLVVDAKNGLSGNWVNTVEGPSGLELVKAAVDTTLDASVGAGYTAFERTMKDWQSALVSWRCGLSASERVRLGVPPRWNCHDLRFFVGRLAFDQLDPERAARLEQVATRFYLPPQEVEDVISAGHDTLKQSPVLRAFLSSL